MANATEDTGIVMTEEASANVSFEEIITKMPEYLRELEDCEIIRKDGTGQFSPSLPAEKGIYVLYEDNKPMYVGRSDSLRDRLHNHGRPSSTHNSASFAFNIARNEQLQKLMNEIIRSETDDSIERFQQLCKSNRKELEEEPEFQSLFSKAKRRVRNMGIRVVEIHDPIEQTIFEVYAHMKLGTDPQFNSFENH